MPRPARSTAIPALLACLLAAAPLAAPLHAQRMPSAEGAQVYIITPEDGARVQNPVIIRFGLHGMGVAPAGVSHHNTGHHHLLLNVAPAEIDFDEPIPVDERHRHFGGGQTQVQLDLPPGEHSLFLLLGDEFHVPHEPPVMSDIIRITVE